jgi:DNA-binding NarL/FixJ family response regulator
VANQETSSLDQAKAITAMLAMLVAEREDHRTGDDGEDRPTEVVLFAAGLSDAEIAQLLGKSPNAVKKARQHYRDRAKREKKAVRPKKGL